MVLLLLAGALVVAGCGGSESGQAEPGVTGSTGATTSDSTTTTSAPSPTMTTDLTAVPTLSASPLPPPPSPTGGNQVDVPPNVLDQVRADAAQRTGVAPNQVQIVSTTAQTWNDGSLGCPKPGESYIQVMVDGYQIIVLAGGRTLDYRASQTGV